MAKKAINKWFSSRMMLAGCGPLLESLYDLNYKI
jgi:hypothetical protein